MKTLKRGDIWLVNFDPSFGHEYKKMRPAVIVEADSFLTKSPLITLLPISSQLGKSTKLDILVRKDEHNRLMKDSLIKVMQVSSFDRRRLVKYIGFLVDDYQKRIDSALLDYLEL